MFELYRATFLVVLFFLFCRTATAQLPVQTIRGTVVDFDTQSPLAGAKISITSSIPVMGAIADENGKFSIRGVPVGRHNVVAQYLGYEDKKLSELNLTSGKELVLRIEMSEAYIEAAEVKIVAEDKKDEPVNELAVVSARKFSVEETQRYAASLNDPGRMASAFAGVQPSSDGRNNIIIRGNSPSGMLWRLEGVDVPNPNHFASPGSSGGGVSILSNFLLDNSDFLTGAFPAEYGNALSGVFDLKLRKGNNEKREYGFQFSFLGINAAVEGPFSKKNGASYLASYRYSTLGLFQAFGLPIVQGATYGYQDLNFHLNFPTKKFGTIGFFGLGGLSSQVAQAKKDTLLWKNHADRTNDKYGTNMGAAGLTHTYLFQDGKTWLRSALSLSGSNIYGRTDTLNSSLVSTLLESQNFISSKASFTTMLNHKFTVRHLLRTGIFVDYLFYKLGSGIFNYQTGKFENQIAARGGSFLIQPYAQYRLRLFEKLTLNTGLHALLFTLNKTWSIEPRAGIAWAMTKHQNLSFGYGLHSQILPLGTYFTEFTLTDGSVSKPNRNLGLSKAHHFVMGHDLKFSPNLHLKTEIYFQSLFNIPVGMPSNPTLSILNTNWAFETDSLSNTGKGRNYGVEFTFEKFFSKNYYFLLTTSLYESKYLSADKIWRDTRFNGNYAFNILGGKEIYIGKKKKQYFEFSGRVVWQGGQRFTPIDLPASIQAGRTRYVDTEAFQQRKKDYFRTDIRVAWHNNRRRTSHTISFDVQNLFNTKNDFVQDYDNYTKAIKQYYQAGFVPIFAYRIDF